MLHRVHGIYLICASASEPLTAVEGQTHVALWPLQGVRGSTGRCGTLRTPQQGPPAKQSAKTGIRTFRKLHGAAPLRPSEPLPREVDCGPVRHRDNRR